MGLLLWAACGAYMCIGIAWLLLRGVGEGRYDRVDKAVAAGLVVAIPAFLALMLAVDSGDYQWSDLPWWRLLRKPW